MDEEKNFIEFLETIIELHRQNINYYLEVPTRPIRFHEKYADELKKVGDVINSFAFMNDEE